MRRVLFWTAVLVFAPQLGATPIVPGYPIRPFAAVDQPRNIAFDPTTGSLVTLGRDNGELYTIDSDGTVSMKAQFEPTGHAAFVGPTVDPQTGEVYISDYQTGTGDRVLKVNSDGEVDVVATGIPRPTGTATGPDGTVYVANYEPVGMIYRIEPGDEGPEPFATGVSLPDGIAFGPDGQLYIANRGTHSIKIVGIEGGEARKYMNGFRNPMSVVFDESGRMFVLNFNDGTISKVERSGTVTIFGSGFVAPVGMAFGSNNDLYIADCGASMIYKVDLPEPSPWRFWA